MAQELIKIKGENVLKWYSLPQNQPFPWAILQGDLECLWSGAAFHDIAKSAANMAKWAWGADANAAVLHQ